MRLISLLLASSLVFGVSAIGVSAETEPPELSTARTRFEARVTEALRPIQRQYTVELESLKRNLTQKSDLRGALAVQAEIDKIAKPTNDKWIVLFNSDDPREWNTQIVRDNTPAATKYLRLKRCDKNETVIIKVTKDEISAQTTPDGKCFWYGVNDNAFGGYHLGICDLKKSLAKGCIVINRATTNERPGWGFGHKAYINNSQGYSWAGKEISKTVFEIAVTASELTMPEQRDLLK